MLSQGTPMMLMGDEYGHTKGGNNNTYGLDGTRRVCDAMLARTHACTHDGAVLTCIVVSLLS
jgi:hypothetical protein